MEYSRPLLTFALVKQSLEKTGDFVQGLMPLFAPIIKKNAHKDFDAKEFVKAVDEYYGIRMHPYVADDWRDRLTKEGYLHAVERDGLIERYINLDPDVPIGPSYADRYNALLDDFGDYIDDAFRKRGLQVKRTTIETAIFNRLKTMEFLSILKKRDKSSTPSNVLSLATEKTDEEDDEQIDLIETQFDVLCAAFALKLHQSDQDKFALLSEMTGGALISEVVLGLRVPPKSGQSAQGLMVFVDAPLALAALNLADEEEYEFIHLLFNDLRNMGASLRIFLRSIEEIERIIFSIIKKQREGEYVHGTIGTRLRTDSLAMTRLLEISKSLEEKLMEISIGVVNFDEEYSELYKFFPVQKETDLVSRIRIFRELTARETDARTLANVMRLVMSVPKKSNVFASNAIFLTKNAAVVRQGMAYFSKEHMLSDEQAPPFITDRYMAGLLFVAQGGRGEDIPRRKLIANCAAAVAPRQDVVTRMMSVLEQVDEASAPELEALMTEKRCSYYLMESSLGDADIITKDNALEIIEGIRRVIAEQVAREKELEKGQALRKQKKDLESRRARAAKKHKDELAGVQKSLIETKTQLDHLTEEMHTLRQSLDVVEKKSIEQERQLFGPCIEAGNRAGYLRAAKIYFFIALAMVFLAVAVDPFTKLIHSIFWRETITILLIFIVIFVIGLVQFWKFPDLLFGKRIRKAQEGAFRKRAIQLGLAQIAEKYDVDWKTKTLLTKGK